MQGHQDLALLILRAKVINTSDFGNKSNIMDILNAFVVNQDKTEFIFGKGKSQPPPPTGWGFCLFKTTDNRPDNHKVNKVPDVQAIYTCKIFPLSDQFLLKDLLFQIKRFISIFSSFAHLNSRI